MSFIFDFKIKNVSDVNCWKRSAFNAGRFNISFSEWRKKTEIGKTDFQTGLVAEIIVAWMLGVFKSASGIHFFVRMNWYLDNVEKADFAICRNGKEAMLQMKFENNRSFILPSNVMRVDLAAAKNFGGRRCWKHAEAGDMALFRVLMASGLFIEEEVYEAFDNERLVASLKEAWSFLKN